jgi:hypothetical protein
VSALVLVALLGFCLGLAACGSDDSTSGAGAGATKTLSWAVEPSATGYKLYWGTTSQRYDSNVDVGPNVSYTLTDLKAGTNYYFAVSAYNAGGESGLSAEVSSYVD